MTIEEGREYIDRAIKWAHRRRMQLTHDWGIYMAEDGIWRPKLPDLTRSCMCPMAMVILYAQNVEKKKFRKLNQDATAASILGTRKEYVGHFTNGFDGSTDHKDTKRAWYLLGKEFETKYQSKICMFKL